MQKILFIVFATFGMIALSFAGSSAGPVPYSPYADVTINTHWDPEYEDMEPMDLDKISQTVGINSYNLAFIVDMGSCHPAWGGMVDYSVDSAWAKHLTDKLQKLNVQYTISFGGAAGSDISNACSDSDLLAKYEQVIETYHPNGLDFDIENGTAIVPKIMNALRTIQEKHPDLKLSFTLPVLPEGLTGSGQDVVRQAHDAKLNYAVNIMAMDYGDYYSGDMGAYAIQAANNTHKFLESLYPDKSKDELWTMVQVTPMIGVNDVNSEHFTLTNTEVLRGFAEQVQLGALSMWSIARDQPCPDKWASPTCSGANLQEYPYDFSRTFLNKKSDDLSRLLSKKK